MNITATERLAKLTSARSILLVYISTDYVFPGPPGEAPYEATSAPKPPNLYGQTKLDGEKVVIEVSAERDLGVVLRVPVLYGAVEDSVGNKESAINVLMDAVWKAQEKEAKVVMDDWAQRYPTNTEDVARVLVDLAAKYLDTGEGSAGLPKILQFSSEDRMTKYQICQVLADMMGLPLDGMVANKDGGGGGVQRPYDTHLSSQSLKDLGISTRTMDFTAWWYVKLCPCRPCSVQTILNTPNSTQWLVCATDVLTGDGRLKLTESKTKRSRPPKKYSRRCREHLLLSITVEGFTGEEFWHVKTNSLVSGCEWGRPAWHFTALFSS